MSVEEEYQSVKHDFNCEICSDQIKIDLYASISKKPKVIIALLNLREILGAWHG